MATTDPDRARLLSELAANPDPEVAKFGRNQLRLELRHQRTTEKTLLATERCTLIGAGALALVVTIVSIVLGLVIQESNIPTAVLVTEVLGLCGVLAGRSYWGAGKSTQKTLTELK